MADAQLAVDRNWRAVHGGLLFGLFVIPLVVPALQTWPWFMAVPLAVYAAVVAVVPPLRRSVAWLRVGRLGSAELATSAGLAVVSCSALAAWFVWLRPDVSNLTFIVPNARWEWIAAAGLGFSLLNAVMEEAVFRGIFQDAFEAAGWGKWWAAVLQGVLFGVVHSAGFPRGILGAAMACVFGSALGLIRVWTRGLAAGFLAHVAADAMIFALLAGAAG
jgi:membrane protease YdiL (CAAX protease family)